ncbi:LamG-like jellyroll fold domain-containing protein [Microbacterium sp. cx-59]|uniref:LamG-like jellyroll fold domain-containing protein n=1 Tax=Microbacterium sp. cx-59 TaxID=2891207 RepID=UPI001E62BEEF|nr:LamG-like jellyroll fold domain-containing protein [Microbacterium sp. cx-59]MCC4908066.1 fibronectin type III domain-containing protein [Microbacterium sp. cx-59]
MRHRSRTSARPGRTFAAALTTTAVLAASLVSAAAPAAHAAVSLPDPSVRYSFDGDASLGKVANDGSLGAAFDARVRNAPTLARGDGPTDDAGSSGLLPGGAQNSPSSDKPYLEIPAGLFDDADALTVSTWIKWDGKNASQLPWAYIVGSDALPADNWGVYYVPNEGGQSKAAANSGSEVKAVSPAPLSTDTWTYITSVVDGSTLSYYINGSLVRSEAVTVDFAKLASASSTRSGLIGRVPWAGPWAAFFGGEFDDFSVYREALTAAQVEALFSGYVGEIVGLSQETWALTTPAGIPPVLPSTVAATREAGPAVDAPIEWERVRPADYANAGSVFTVAGTVDGWDGTLTATVTVDERLTEDVTVDFSETTGEFRGGASGTLYGLGDEGSPTQALVNGAAMTNVSQKPPFGTQHPGGDAFHIEDSFFDKHGKDLYVYTQDFYPDWPYNGGRRPGDDLTFTRGDDGRLTGERTSTPNGRWDYLEVLEIVVDEIARESDNPEKYVFIPFNEVDLQWLNSDDLYNRYMHVGGQPDSFTPDGATDWTAAWDVITDTYAKYDLERPRIAGPGDAAWRGEGNITSFLKMAIDTDTVPDVYVWHELRGYQWMPQRAEQFRQYARNLGIAPEDVPQVNITEWGASTDMSSPANLLRWFASFEAAKIDAQTAYWTASGTLSDNQAKVNAANGGWWLFKWYGDLTGSETVRVPLGEQKAIAAIDEESRRAQVIVAGIADGRDGALALEGLDPGTFGDAVDIEVREALVSGTDGISGAPRVVAAFDGAAIVNGRVDIRIPSANASSAYQVIVTPAAPRDVAAALSAQSERHVIEAERVTLQSASERTPDGYRASADRDVSGFAALDSRADWTVDIEEPGLYRLQILGATPGVPVQHALFVDDAFDQIVQYGANAIKPSNVRGVARGSAEVAVALAAGENTLSLRTSEDGTTLLANAGYEGGVTLDRFELVRIGDDVNTESVRYPASTFRLAEGATLTWDGAARGSARLDDGERIDLYPSAYESGYYDVSVDWAADGDARLELTVDGRVASTFDSSGGDTASRVRVHLPEGISEVELRSSGPATVSGVTTTRAVEGDARIVRVEAEDLTTVTLGGSARVSGFGDQPTTGVGTSGSGDGFVQGLGITDANPANEGTLSIPRGDGFAAAGQYNAVVHFSNDDIEGTHDYNPQVVDLGLQASEGGVDGLAGRTTFRYTYLATNFWEAVMPLNLRTDGGAIEFGNTRSTLFIDEGPTGSTSDDQVRDGYAIAPDVDWIAFAPFVLDTDGEEPTVPDAPAVPSVSVSGSSATVAWAAPADGGSDVTSYRVELWAGPALAATGRVAAPVRTVTVTNGLAAQMRTTLAGLADGSYTARIVALNGVGESGPSPASAVFTVSAGAGAGAGGGGGGGGGGSGPGSGPDTGDGVAAAPGSERNGSLAATGMIAPIGALLLLGGLAIAAGFVARARARRS